MFATLPLSNRPARALTTLAVVGVAMLTACDTDQSVAPTPATTAATTTRPDLSVSPSNSGTLVLKVFDQNQSLIQLPFTAFKITGPNNSPWMAYDNGANDADGTLGVLIINSMSPGLYKVCETGPVGDYGVAGMSCRGVTVYAGSSSGLYFTNPPATHIKFTVADAAQNLQGPSIFTFDSTNVAMPQINDNNAPDVDPTVGKFDLRIRFEATYKVCAAQAPFSYVFVAGETLCYTKTIKMGMAPIDLGNFAVIKQYSATWQVTDGTLDPNSQYNLIGPSTFKVYFPGGSTADAVDNGNADEDPTIGKIAVTLPWAGDYTVCETVPPTNHWNAQPACKQFTVSAGVPVSLGYFINYEKQVFRP